MSDNPQISLEEAINLHSGDGTPAEEQAAQKEEVEDQSHNEAETVSESDDEAEDQPETESEVDDDGEPDETEDDQDEEEEEPVFAITIDGEEKEVTLGELTNGYLRESDYTRKTQALAEQRKATESQAEQAALAVQKAVADAEALDALLLGNPPVHPDISLARTDPVAYEEQKYAVEQWNVARQNLQAYKDQAIGERTQAETKKRQELANAEANKFLKAFPEVTDAPTMNAKVGTIQGYLVREMGYDPQSLAGMVDHRSYVIADKAMKYDELLKSSKSKSAVKVAKAKTKPVTSSSHRRMPKQSSKRDQAKERFNNAVSKPTHELNRTSAIDMAAEALAAAKG